MKTNPGGQLSPEEIVGRDPLIAEMWDILTSQSIYMNDLRRIGKTQIMVKMHAKPPQNWVAAKCDLGGIHTPEEFATQAFRMSQAVFDAKARNFRRMSELLGKLAGIEIAGVIKLPDGKPAPWKEVLRRTFADLNEEMTSRGPDHRIVLLWDEVPFLLDNIKNNRSCNHGSQIAMEILGTLRALGQDHERVRLVLTGSIGLHHVLKSLHAEGYNGSPLNRMRLLQPGPHSPEEAIRLAQNLLVESNIPCEDVNRCARHLAKSAGGVAFYIHKLVSRLQRSGTPHSPESIEALLDREILADDNDWDFAHYRNRLKPYYGPHEKLALHVLDTLAVGEPLDFPAIRKAVNARQHVDEEQLRDLLNLLSKDHYLVRTEENQYRFYLTLIRRWWRLDRSL